MRHSQVANWARSLREAVECFGEQMGYRKDIGAFYHGVSESLLFESTNIRLFGPVSTTAGMYAYFFFKSDPSFVFGLRMF